MKNFIQNNTKFIFIGLPLVGIALTLFMPPQVRQTSAAVEWHRYDDKIKDIPATDPWEGMPPQVDRTVRPPVQVWVTQYSQCEKDVPGNHIDGFGRFVCLVEVH